MPGSNKDSSNSNYTSSLKGLVVEKEGVLALKQVLECWKGGGGKDTI